MIPIRRVGVLGAGTMGAQIAAHLANAGVPSVLLDRVPDGTAGAASVNSPADRAGARSTLARAGLDAALKARPPAFFLPDDARLVVTGNFEDHLALLRECDWIIEAVAEDFEIKRLLLERIQPFINSQAIVSSNTSGISVARLAGCLSPDLRRRWLGTHFFNPPRYLKLLELIRGPDTLPEVVARIERFGDELLGKGIVRAKDRPNFIANRIGVFFHLACLQLMEEEQLSVETVDALTGPLIGLPKSATLRTADVVGLDVMAHVVRNLREALPEEADSFRVPGFMEKMIGRQLLGEKTKQGFYKRVKSGGESEIRALDLSTFEYRPQKKVRFDALEPARNIAGAGERVRALFELPDRIGEFYRGLLGSTLHYAASRIPEISDDIVSIDRALRWGFNWEYGPFELADGIGIERLAAFWRQENLPTPPIIGKLLNAGKRSFYLRSGSATVAFDFHRADYAPVEERPGILLLSSLKAAGGEIKKNAGASLIDLGDGVVCLEFHSKMNTLGPDAIEIVRAGLKQLNENFDAMVIGNNGANFSAGANLMLLLLSIEEGEWDDIHEAVRAFQNANMALKYAPKPVIAAPFGLTLGGGVEISLHCARRVAAAETYMGLVEAGVGLIPAGGGAKEMLLRTADAAGKAAADLLPALEEAFKNIGMAKVSGSAAEARKYGYLSDSDAICMNRDRQLAAAKQVARDAAALGYTAGAPRDDVMAPGALAFARMKLALHLMRRAEYISEHDVVIGTKLAQVLSGGGQWTSPQRVSEQYLLDLEREAFVSLCGEKKTVERIQHMLKTGKALRN